MTSIGRTLTEAREARGLSLEQVERDTRIGRKYLLALEGERFEEFSDPVYARGFLRSYAGYLRLNAADLIARMPQPQPQDDHAAHTGRPRSRAGTHGGAASRRPAAGGGADASGMRRRPPAEADAGTSGSGSGVPAPGGGHRSRSLPGGAQPPLGSVRRRAAGARSGTLPPVLLIGGLVLAAVLLAFTIGSLGGGGGAAPGGASPGGFPGSARSSGSPPTPTGGGAVSVPSGSSSTARGTMPDLRGQELEPSLTRLREQGVTPFLIERPSRDAPAGQIIRQSPPPGANLEGQVVTLVISQGG